MAKFNKGFILCWLATFLTLIACGFIAYALLLDEFFRLNAGDIIWRHEDNQKIGWLLFGDAIMAYIMVVIYAQLIDKSSIKSGIKFGLLLGIFWGSVEFLNYAFLPMSMARMWGSFASDVAIFTIAGGVLAATYDHHKH